MHQELFRIPFLDRPVYGYGLMLVIGFLCAAQLAKFLAGRCRLNGETFINAALLALISGVIGARLSHVIESLATGGKEFANNGKSVGENFLAMLNVSSGGLTFYGGFLLATPVLIAYALWKKVPLLKGMDIIAPCLMVGLAFGRIGCYMNGCCYGAECNLPWGAAFPYGSNAFVEQFEKNDERKKEGKPELVVPTELTITKDNQVYLKSREEIRKNPELSKLADSLHAHPVQPTEIYSAVNAFLIAAVLLAYFSNAPAPGRVFALMLILKGMSRFVMEMLRVEPPVWFIGSLDWSFSMGVSAMLIAAGVVMWFACGAIRRARNETGGGRIAVAPAA